MLVLQIREVVRNILWSRQRRLWGFRRKVWTIICFRFGLGISMGLILMSTIMIRSEYYEISSDRIKRTTKTR
jgi:hypothetical protein